MFEVLAFNRGPGFYLPWANKYRYSLEKHCYDKYGSEDEKIHCFQNEGPLSNWREEFTERAAAFNAALGQGAPVEENDPFADLEPDIFEEERSEIVVHED